MKLFSWVKRRQSVSNTASKVEASKLRALEDMPHSESSRDSVDHVKQGVASLGAGDFQSAVSAFRRSVVLAPDSAANHVNLAYALQEIGEGAEALLHLRQAVALDAESFDAHYMLAAALERKMDCPGAAEHLRHAVKLRPEFEPARGDLCRVLTANGDLAEARTAIHDSIALNPGNADFHQYLGNLCMAASDPEAAVLSYLRALALQPSDAQVHTNLGLALHAQRKYDEAARSLERALEIDTHSSEALLTLGLCRRAQGRLDEAAVSLQRALALKPDHAEALNSLGSVFLEQSLLDRAVDTYRQVVVLRPEQPGGHVNLGLALYARKDFDAAVHSFERALEIEPQSSRTFALLGLARKAQGRLSDAEAALRRAIAVKPDDVDALNDLGSVLLEQGLLDLAIDAYRRAVSMHPGRPSGYANLGAALFDNGEVAQCAAVCREGLKLGSIGELHSNLAIALQEQGALEEAMEHFQKALTLQPDNVNTLCNFAAALAEAGDMSLSIAASRRVLELKPSHLAAHSAMIFNLSFFDDCNAEDYLAETRRFNAKLLRGLLEPPNFSSPGRARPLRVGFVSGDLRGHPVGYFLEGILHHLNSSRIELFAYPTVVKEDELSARIKPLFKVWRSIKGRTDEDVARSIRGDAIDILIDLSGHSEGNRLAAFALRPAPVQLSWLGYFASTGVSEIDYIIADDVCVPTGNEHMLSEKVWRLPDTRLCFTPPDDSSTPAVAPLPALARGHITFGCFQRFPKIGEAVLSLWGRVFAELPDARLLMQCHQSARQAFVDRMMQRLAAVGITGDRVWIREPAQRADYLRVYGEVDIVLDTFPYNGGTTTCEALWMGVPTLTLAGSSMLARQGAALLTVAGLGDWVATDQEQFVAKAVAFAKDPVRMAALRESLRERVRASPLFDTRLFARRLEAALNSIWARTETFRGAQRNASAAVTQTVEAFDPASGK